MLLFTLAAAALLGSVVGNGVDKFGPSDPECKLPNDYCAKAVEAGQDCITPLFYGLVSNNV